MWRVIFPYFYYFKGMPLFKTLGTYSEYGPYYPETVTVTNMP